MTGRVVGRRRRKGLAVLAAALVLSYFGISNVVGRERGQALCSSSAGAEVCLVKSGVHFQLEASGLERESVAQWGEKPGSPVAVAVDGDGRIGRDGLPNICGWPQGRAGTWTLSGTSSTGGPVEVEIALPADSHCP